jgi:hypothetical protein
MPSCHAYTIATGNSEVKKLIWHESTSSLMASTQNRHGVTRGSYRQRYLYGDSMDSEDAEDVVSYWPKKPCMRPDISENHGVFNKNQPNSFYCTLSRLNAGWVNEKGATVLSHNVYGSSHSRQSVVILPIVFSLLRVGLNQLINLGIFTKRGIIV